MPSNYPQGGNFHLKVGGGGGGGGKKQLVTLNVLIALSDIETVSVLCKIKSWGGGKAPLRNYSPDPTNKATWEQLFQHISILTYTVGLQLELYWSE